MKQKSHVLSTIETKLEKAKQDFEPYKAQEELNQIHELFPMMKEQLRVAGIAKQIELGVEYVKQLFENRTLTASSFKFRSPEHNREFETQNVRFKIEKEPDNPEKLRLNLNGVNIFDWFKQKYKELKESIRPRVESNMNKGKGFRM